MEKMWEKPQPRRWSRWADRTLARVTRVLVVAGLVVTVMLGWSWMYGNSPLTLAYAHMPVDSVRVVENWDYVSAGLTEGKPVIDDTVTDASVARGLYGSIFASQPISPFTNINCGLGPQINYALWFTFHGVPVLHATMDLQACDFIHLDALGARWASNDFLGRLARIAPQLSSTQSFASRDVPPLFRP